MNGEEYRASSDYSAGGGRNQRRGLPWKPPPTHPHFNHCLGVTVTGAYDFGSKGAITSKIKLAIKHKTSPARLAQLLQPSLAFCFSLQSMTAYRPVQQLYKSCRTCFMFYCKFYFTCDRSLSRRLIGDYGSPR